MAVPGGLEPTDLESNTITTSVCLDGKCLYRHSVGKWQHTVMTGQTTKNREHWPVIPKLMTPSAATASTRLTCTTGSGDLLLLCVLGQRHMCLLSKYHPKGLGHPSMTSNGVGRRVE